jgi:ABC-type Fe3+-hydroxamate transport system substrate-binding protein
MRIVSLHPFTTDILDYCGIGWNLVGLTHVCSVPKNSAKAKILTAGPHQKFMVSTPELKDVAKGLCTFELDIEKMIDCIPDVILADVIHPDKERFIPWAEQILRKQIGKSVTIQHLALNTLEDVYSTMAGVGRLISKPRLAEKLVAEIQKHITKWADSYSHLCKGKKVVLLSETTPLIVEAGWVDDLVHLFGALTLDLKTPSHRVEVTWRELLEGRPDVLFVAPHNAYLNQSVRRLPALETSEGWEELPAVKRGAVFFAPGTDIYRPGPRFLKGVAALVAAMAGLEKPIFQDQDESYRIRQVEMFRHKLLEPRG